eukprot:TRINITY_DN13862_c0_g1_i2.p4 TRINITY_DN13862_c0_g1~~TRINITY_DN13862_c0_g1_i2.p4  ORF type:complete len:118 (-),score=25.79 TRINITY_DN13862_c0_g1_i2:763-1086(-)
MCIRDRFKIAASPSIFFCPKSISYADIRKFINNAKIIVAYINNPISIRYFSKQVLNVRLKTITKFTISFRRILKLSHFLSHGLYTNTSTMMINEITISESPHTRGVS